MVLGALGCMNNEDLKKLVNDNIVLDCLLFSEITTVQVI